MTKSILSLSILSLLMSCTADKTEETPTDTSVADTGDSVDTDETDDTEDTEETDTEDTDDTEDADDTNDSGNSSEDGLGEMPRIGAFLTDLDPGLGGTVYFDTTQAGSVLTFVDVPLYDESTMVNTFQVELNATTHEIVISYLVSSLEGSTTGSASGGLAIGVADGNGLYDSVDLSDFGMEALGNPVEGFGESHPFDLTNKQITFTPSSDSTSYSASVTTITELPNEYSNIISVVDDSFTSQEMAAPFQFYGVPFTFLYINNDGNITFKEGDPTCVCWVCPPGDGECASQYLAGAEIEDRN